MQAVILAAGRGTRLQPVTLTRSKAMVPVAGRPMIDWVLETLVVNGIRDYIFVISADDADIRAYYAMQTEADVRVRFVVQEERLGAAHALRLAAPYIDGDVIVTACDSLKPAEHIADLIGQHRRTDATVTLSLCKVPPARIPASGIVDWRDGRVQRIIEKPTPEEAPSNIGSLPLYIFAHSYLEKLAQIQPSVRGEYELQDAIQMVIDEGGLVTGLFAPSRRQITTIDDLLALNRDLLSVGSTDVQERFPQATFLQPLIVENDVEIGAGATVGPNVVLEQNARIGHGATVRDAIVLRESVVAPDTTVSHCVVTLSQAQCR